MRSNPDNRQAALSLQDKFLAHCVAEKLAVTVFLVNGVKLQGVVVGFDAYTMLLRRDGHVQLVYKQATSTVMPNEKLEDGWLS